MADVNITADKREISTKGAVNQLRRDGIVPGVLYSKEVDPINFSIPELALKPIVYTTEMHLIDLKVGKSKSIKCILKDIQFDPLTDKIIHIDFQAITVGQIIQVQVPINFIGQPVGVKEGGRLNQNLHKLEIECLPKYIPQQLDIDITNLNVGDSILIKDLSFENITLLSIPSATVVAVTVSRDVEETEETEDIAPEVEDEQE